MSLQWTQDSGADRGAPGHLIAVVISHADAPIGAWRRLLLDQESVRRILAQASAVSSLDGIAVVATCSRTDVYAEVRDPVQGARDVVALLRDVAGASATELSLTRTLHGMEAVRHLFRVAAGLESIALGEHEILGQVRGALHLSMGLHVAGPVVHRLLERALSTGGRVRHETQIGHGATTLGFAAAELITASGPPVAQALAVVVGAGHMARQAARHLRAHGFARLAVVNRSLPVANELARQLHATAHPLDELPSLLADASAVVAAVRGDTPVIGAAMLAAARAPGAGPLRLVDLGSPHNIDPRCDALPGVERFDLDALHLQLASARSTRASKVHDAAEIVELEVERFVGWWQHRHLVPAARLLRESFLSEAQVVVEREVRRAEPGDRQQLQRFADALVRRLLHRPLTHLQAIARESLPNVGGSHALPERDRFILDAFLTGDPAPDHHQS